jgi:molybdopterin synthase sulfur carrier subunit
MKIRVLYFAVLRESRGLSEEVIETSAADACGLYQELCSSLQLHLPMSALRVAINDEFVKPSQRLMDGGVVAFIPPVAGG